MEIKSGFKGLKVTDLAASPTTETLRVGGSTILLMAVQYCWWQYSIFGGSTVLVVAVQYCWWQYSIVGGSTVLLVAVQYWWWQ